MEKSFSKLVYEVFDANLADKIKPIVLNISKTSNGNIDDFADKSLENPQKLFCLYCELKKFADFGLEAYGNEDFKTKYYFEWFIAKVNKSSKISVFNALPRLDTN